MHNIKKKSYWNKRIFKRKEKKQFPPSPIFGGRFGKNNPPLVDPCILTRIFHVSVTASIILLTALSLVLRKCLLTVLAGKQTDWKIKSIEMAHNEHQQSNLQNVIEALYSQNDGAIKELIVSQNDMLCQVLMLINRGAHDLSERRSINKSFLDSPGLNQRLIKFLP